MYKGKYSIKFIFSVSLFIILFLIITTPCVKPSNIKEGFSLNGVFDTEPRPMFLSDKDIEINNIGISGEKIISKCLNTQLIDLYKEQKPSIGVLNSISFKKKLDLYRFYPKNNLNPLEKSLKKKEATDYLDQYILDISNNEFMDINIKNSIDNKLIVPCQNVELLINHNNEGEIFALSIDNIYNLDPCYFKSKINPLTNEECPEDENEGFSKFNDDQEYDIAIKIFLLMISLLFIYSFTKFHLKIR